MSRTAAQNAWREANRERERAYERERRRKLYGSSDASREQKNRALREWRARRAATDPQFRAKQTADNTRRHRERMQNDPEYRERHRGYQLRNLAKRRWAVSDGEHFTREEIYARDGGVCHLCLEPATRDEYAIDHVIPLARGGKHARGNVAVAHPECNARKGAKLLA